MKIYGIKNCDKCQEAAKALGGLEIIDIRKLPLSSEMLTRVVERFGDDAVNKRSTTWRTLEESERMRPALDLLADHPTLLKRPLIETPKGELFSGWSKEVKQALLP